VNFLRDVHLRKKKERRKKQKQRGEGGKEGKEEGRGNQYDPAAPKPTF